MHAYLGLIPTNPLITVSELMRKDEVARPTLWVNQTLVAFRSQIALHSATSLGRGGEVRRKMMD